MNDKHHLARLYIRRLGNEEPTVAESVRLLRDYAADKGLDEATVASELAAAQTAGKLFATPHDAELATRADALRWTDEKPTAEGSYLWRKDRKWEPVRREVRRLTSGHLGVFSHRFENWVPLHFLDAFGSQWFVPDFRRECATKTPVEAGVWTGGAK